MKLNDRGHVYIFIYLFIFKFEKFEYGTRKRNIYINGIVAAIGNQFFFRKEKIVRAHACITIHAPSDTIR